MSTNNGVTPSSYDLIILVHKNIKRFFGRTKMLVYETFELTATYMSITNNTITEKASLAVESVMARV
jgi:hypothetical protein